MCVHNKKSEKNERCLFSFLERHCRSIKKKRNQSRVENTQKLDLREKERATRAISTEKRKREDMDDGASTKGKKD